MQVDKTRAALTQHQENQTLARFAMLGIVSSALVAGVWAESWILGIAVLILSPIALAAPDLRKLGIAVFTLMWGYLGLRFGSWVGGGVAALVCGSVGGVLSYAAHSAFAQMVDNSRSTHTGLQAIHSNNLPPAQHPAIMMVEQGMIDLKALLSKVIPKLYVALAPRTKGDWSPFERSLVNYTKFFSTLTLAIVLLSMVNSISSGGHADRISNSSVDDSSLRDKAPSIELSSDDIARRVMSTNPKYPLDKERWNDAKDLARFAYPAGW